MAHLLPVGLTSSLTLKYLKGNRQLVVFIDDLDRCAPPKPVEIIEAINLLLPDDNHCVFILGMDSSAVAASIEVKYKDLSEFLATSASPGELTLGQRFLEKIVQINFHIPSTDVPVVETFINTILAAQPENTVVDSPAGETEEAAQLIQDVQSAGKTLNASA
jgi:predicted KAP-like P-loop ATPase